MARHRERNESGFGSKERIYGRKQEEEEKVSKPVLSNPNEETSRKSEEIRKEGPSRAESREDELERSPLPPEERT